MSATAALADVPVAILAGGLARRLGAVTRAMPKALVEVAGRPFIDHQLRLLARRGARRVVLCLGHLGEPVRDHVGDGRAFGLEVAYSFDGDALLGTGGALKRAEPLLGRAAFFVTYGDSYLDVSLRAVLDASGLLGLMTVLRNDGRWDRSNVRFDAGILRAYDKRHPTPDMAHIDYGLAVLHTDALARIAVGQPYDLADLYGMLVAQGLMGGFEVRHRFYEIGSPQGLEETRAFLEGEEAASPERDAEGRGR